MQYDAHLDIPLSHTNMSFLTRYLSPAYLQLHRMKTTMAKFVNETNIQLQGFLADELAAALQGELVEADVITGNGLDGTSCGGMIPRYGPLGVPPSSDSSARTQPGSSTKTARTKV